MISLKTVCLLYFALLVGLTHVEEAMSQEANGTNAQGPTKDNTTTARGANSIKDNDIPPQVTNSRAITDTKKGGEGENNHDKPYDKTMKNTSTDKTSSSSSSLKATSQPPVCLTTTCNPQERCIFSLPTGDKLHLIVAVLIVGCLVLLMTTLMCACQVCHLKELISGLQSRHDNIGLCAIREKSETPQKNEEQADGHPTENCVLLSEVTTGQEQSKELEVKIEEVKVKEMEPTGTEMPVIDPNGDVNQENSIKPEEKQPESSGKPEV